SKQALCAIAAAMGLSVATSNDASASETSWLHRSVALSVNILGTTYWVDHTWAESMSADAGGQNDETQSYPSHAVCISSVYEGCAGHRDSMNWQTSSNHVCNRPQIQACYRNSSPGGYAWNGVCHQATNRALAETPVYWVRYLPINGGTLSYNIFGDYGASFP